MYTESNPIKQREVFSDALQFLPARKRKMLEDPTEWHNVFFVLVTGAIAEECFKKLYCDNNGRPNAPIRILVAMIILKEGHGWTDQQLFYEARFNLMVMKALGLADLSEDIPTESTYYDFKRKLTEYQQRTGINLLDECFKRLTAGKIKKFNVLANKVRMDSKLVQSNIAVCSRVQLIIQAVSLFYKGLSDKQKDQIVKKRDRQYLDELIAKTPTNHTYEMTNDQKESTMGRLGHLIRKLLNIYHKEQPSCYAMLKRLYEEQYEEKTVDQDQVEDDRPDDDGAKASDAKATEPTIAARDRKEVGSSSLQSVHDQDAAYRKKGSGQNQQVVRGYNANVTETYADVLRLITEIQILPANAGDEQFLVSAIEKTEQVSGQQVTDINTDGGYDSLANRNQFGKDQWNDKKWHLANTKGARSYHFEMNADGQVAVTDLKTGIRQIAVVARNGKYRINCYRVGKTKYRYFKPEVVDSYLILNKVVSKDKEERKARANVESTIHQMFCKLNGNKVRYRGLPKIENYVISRAIWVNFTRILKQINENWPEMAQNGLFSVLTKVLKPFQVQVATIRIIVLNFVFCQKSVRII